MYQQLRYLILYRRLTILDSGARDTQVEGTHPGAEDQLVPGDMELPESIEDMDLIMDQVQKLLF